MHILDCSLVRCVVALLAEGVDRNQKVDKPENRRLVALLAEGVDRNSSVRRISNGALCRPPRGGRG